MATTTTSGLAGPAAFKDLFPEGVDAAPAPRPKEYDDIISTLPSNPKVGLSLYQGTWVAESWVPGIIEIQRSFTPRHGDVVLASSPKCGTTWLKALAFATMARGAYPPGAEEHPLLRHTPQDCVPCMETHFGAGWGSKMDTLPSPRLMATHMQHSILPASITTNPDCKIVYIWRDPKDMIVSMWHFIKEHRQVSFYDIFELTCEGRSVSSPIWDHILGYWNASNESPERVLFLRYEEMLRDPISNVKKLAKFLGQPFSITEEEEGVVTDIVKLCSFERLRNLEINKAGNSGVFTKFSRESYFRKGESGDWVNHMTNEMAQRLDAILEQRFRGSGLALM